MIVNACFFCNDTATTEIYTDGHTLSLHDALPISELLADPGRCIHIGDRESDIYELFCAAREAGTHFVIRTCVDRLAGEGDHTIADEMEEVDRKSTRLNSSH